MIKLIVWILLIGGVCYGGICLYLYLIQRSLLYFPHPQTNSKEAEVIWLESDGQRIKIWFAGDRSGPALIYFGGNAEDVSINLPFFKTIAPNYSLYLMNYRGYGGSTGFPREASLYADSLALYDRIKPHHRDVVVMGRSLGTGIATYLASKRPVQALVLVTPYSSMTALAASYYPLMPVSLFLKDRYESVQRAPQITAPLLAMTAEHDEIIPRRISEDLIGSFESGIVESVVIERTGHNNIEQSPAYRLHLERFLNTHSSPRSTAAQ